MLRTKDKIEITFFCFYSIGLNNLGFKFNVKFPLMHFLGSWKSPNTPMNNLCFSRPTIIAISGVHCN